MQHTYPQQGESRAAIHRALDELQAVDLALDDALAVGQDQARPHCRVVLPEASPKAHQFGDMAASGSFDPRVQPLGVVLGKEGDKVLREVVGRLQVRMDLAKKRARLPLRLRQLRRRSDKQPNRLFRGEVIIGAGWRDHTLGFVWFWFRLWWRGRQAGKKVVETLGEPV